MGGVAGDTGPYTPNHTCRNDGYGNNDADPDSDEIDDYEILITLAPGEAVTCTFQNVASESGTTPPAVAFWKLDEVAGTTAADSSPNGNHGTLVNMDPATDWVPGKIGGVQTGNRGADRYSIIVVGQALPLVGSGQEHLERPIFRAIPVTIEGLFIIVVEPLGFNPTGGGGTGKGAVIQGG